MANKKYVKDRLLFNSGEMYLHHNTHYRLLNPNTYLLLDDPITGSAR